jgi:hypothetical protein
MAAAPRFASRRQVAAPIPDAPPVIAKIFEVTVAILESLVIDIRRQDYSMVVFLGNWILSFHVIYPRKIWLAPLIMQIFNSLRLVESC